MTYFNELDPSAAEWLRNLKKRCEERHCRTPKGLGIVERVYQARNQVAGVFRVKVILDSGRVAYFDINDINVF